ncbi:MAG TPA: hypothetical protein VMW62_05775, partial [Chloroflexota bacterium]|nr:hypothetical protein [Chloroflexota bacterium]
IEVHYAAAPYDRIPANPAGSDDNSTAGNPGTLLNENVPIVRRPVILAPLSDFPEVVSPGEQQHIVSEKNKV